MRFDPLRNEPSRCSANAGTFVLKYFFEAVNLSALLCDLIGEDVLKRKEKR